MPPRDTSALISLFVISSPHALNGFWNIPVTVTEKKALYDSVVCLPNRPEAWWANFAKYN